MILLVVVGLVALQRIIEMFYAARNTRALLARGAVEVAPEQHGFFIALHATWLLSMLVVIPWDRIPNWWLIGAFVVLQLLRVWVIRTLGPYWTTRIITIADAPLVRRGPYRFMRHPNYAIVAAELAVLPLAFGSWMLALLFTILNAALLTWRIRTENAALQERRSRPSP